MDSLLDNSTPCSFTSLLNPADRIRLTTIPSRLKFSWFCAEKTLTSDQKSLAAEPFGAAGSCLAVTKKLIDVRHPVVQNLTAVRGRIEAHWSSITLPFPEPSVRLLPLDQISDFERQMHDFASRARGCGIRVGPGLRRSQTGSRSSARCFI